jgi:hypothetical protein
MKFFQWNDGQVRLDRLNSGANVLDNHNRYGSVTDSVLGVVKKAWVDNGKLRATIQLSKRPELASFIQDVKDGHSKKYFHQLPHLPG